MASNPTPTSRFHDTSLAIRFSPCFNFAPFFSFLVISFFYYTSPEFLLTFQGRAVISRNASAMNAIQQKCRPKHQVLVLKCYPRTTKGAVDVKPNSSELSYLLYYATSRRSKIQKIGAFLEKKTASDVWRLRIGYVASSWTSNVNVSDSSESTVLLRHD